MDDDALLNVIKISKLLLSAKDVTSKILKRLKYHDPERENQKKLIILMLFGVLEYKVSKPNPE